MKLLVIALFMCVLKYKVQSLKLPGPRVYVVTPSSRIEDSGRSASKPFYYHSWKRMDGPTNLTTTAAPTTKTKTQDLIFAEFEADKTKNIHKLLEKERITLKPTTTSTIKPIYVPDENVPEDNPDYSSQPSENTEQVSNEKDMTDYFAMYNNMYNHAAPVYIPTIPTTAIPETKLITKATTKMPENNVENVWHIIDNEKEHQYSGGWNEVPINSDNEENSEPNMEGPKESHGQSQSNFDIAIPGFGTNHGNGAENESRAIRTESDIRFPYVNLKPFQLKDMKTPTYGNSKKGNNMFTSLDNFKEMKNPVRGEAQDIMPNQPIDRYNSAQPYLPKYGGNNKQSSPPQPVKTVSNLVPPPPPPPPKVTADDFPAPSSYESFPPYSPAAISQSLPSRPSYQPPVETAARPPLYQPPSYTDDSDNDSGPPTDDNGPPELGYRYKPPSPQKQNFLPTLPPLIKPGGYSYEKPVQDVAEPDNMPDFHGYQYNKPAPPKDHSLEHDDFPELVFDKPHGPMEGGDDMKGDDMGMIPPPPVQGPPADSGFPSDFPVDFKYHHFEDHDLDHDFYHHHHHPTTTTTTTEQPRVNRYSYYYLGKKLYYLPLYFSVYFIIYVAALIVKAVLRHKIVYPNSWRPNDTTSTFFSKRSLDNLASWNPTHDNLHEITGRVTRAISAAAEKYMKIKSKET